MENIYVKRYSEILKEHYSRVKTLNTEIESAKERYAEPYQTEVINGINTRKMNLSVKNKNRIIKLHNDIICMLAKTTFPNVESLTADRLLFENSAFDFTPTEVNAFIERYSSNPTMLRIIQNWLVANHETDTKMNEYTDCYLSIIQPSKKAESYKTFAVSALSLIDRIDSDPNLSQLFIDSYGDEVVGRDLYRTIGNGFELTDYSYRNVPDAIVDSYANYMLTAE